MTAATFTVPVIHHATVFSFNAPTTCGRTEVPKPASPRWSEVTCPACIERRCAYLVDGKARCGGVAGEHRVHWAPILVMDGYPSGTGGGT